MIERNTSVSLQKDEWERMGGGHSTLSSEWKEVVTSKLETVNPYCSFAYAGGGRKKTIQENSRMYYLD